MSGSFETFIDDYICGQLSHLGVLRAINEHVYLP